jgi:large subunit ribosomal protein L17
MRHRKSFNHLSRTSAHRKSMFANMASSLIMHKRIKTTLAKAKALRSYVEPLISKSKEDSTHSRRVVFSYLQDKDAVSELFREVAPKVGERPGGYTRILKLDTRLGDSAEMCFVELVDFNANLLNEKDVAKGKTKKRRGTKKKSERVENPVTKVSEKSNTTDSAIEDAVIVEDVKETPAENESPDIKQDDVKS